MKKKPVLLILILMFLLSALIVTSSAQEREAGVNAGDWYKYSGFDVYWSSDDPDATVPSHVEGINETEWMKVTIVSVTDTNVTGQSVIHFKNGSESSKDFWINVDTGDQEGSIWGWSLISANLNTNDTIYSSEIDSHPRINETVIRTYPDGARETNYVNVTYVDDIPWDYMHAIYYWDRPTGVLVEISYEHQKFGEEHLSWLVRVIESNVWIIPEFPSWTLMLVILVALSFAIVMYKRRLRHIYNNN